ncbi:hypothetical protein TIFTF001_017233 [Ficus carica]|uniref:Uncharacterized protein n=1 Tax=Ficus carica TaxID=3494 RepID=A0AA88DIZ8_FICCA|nr:hypothetical protein TIFTF001_017233 [Ficus carica]
MGAAQRSAVRNEDDRGGSEGLRVRCRLWGWGGSFAGMALCLGQEGQRSSGAHQHAGEFIARGVHRRRATEFIIMGEWAGRQRWVTETPP